MEIQRTWKTKTITCSPLGTRVEANTCVAILGILVRALASILNMKLGSVQTKHANYVFKNFR